jgi:hypothetical protein
MKELNKNRRNFLKYLLFTAIGFIFDKVLDSIQNLISSKKGFELVGPKEGKTKIFENFRVEETKKELKFYDKEGNEILTIEK